MKVYQSNKTYTISGSIKLPVHTQGSMLVSVDYPINALSVANDNNNLKISGPKGDVLTIEQFWQQCNSAAQCSVVLESTVNQQYMTFAADAPVVYAVADGAFGSIAPNTSIYAPDVSATKQAPVTSVTAPMYVYWLGGGAIAGVAYALLTNKSDTPASVKRDTTNANTETLESAVIVTNTMDSLTGVAPPNTIVTLTTPVTGDSVTTLVATDGVWSISPNPLIEGERGLITVSNSIGNSSAELMVIGVDSGTISAVALDAPVTLDGAVPSSFDADSYSAGVDSLLVNDGTLASWNAANAQGEKPLGQAITLTYAFQNKGSKYEDDYGRLVAIDGSYNQTAKAVVRGVFAEVSEFCNITFVENTSQALSGADIRLFSGSADSLGVSAYTLGYAYQPEAPNPKGYGYMGDFFFVNDSSGVTGEAFSTAYGDERNTISHELGHALGLDHPFASSGGNNSGFYPYNSGYVASNNFGELTGGGHDTPATDFLLETLMTYHNANMTNDIADINLTLQSPYHFGVYDIAALQKLYGVNTTTRTGDDVYQYDSNTPVFDTIWDAGGIDSIVQTGNGDAIIDLRGGEYFSRVGFLTGGHISFELTDLGFSANSTVRFDNPDVIFTQRSGHVEAELPITYYHNAAISDDIVMTISDPVKGDVAGTFEYAVPIELAYNLGIAFGVVIENAVGGSGDDTLIGNDVGNVLRGNAGNDTLVASLGADTYVGGSGKDVLVVNNVLDINHDVWSDFDSSDVIDLSSLNLSQSDVSWHANTHTLSVADTHGGYVSMVINSTTNYQFTLADVVL